MTDFAGAGRSTGFLGIVSTAGLGLLPKLTCPLCWPAYSTALGALGLGFVDYTPYLLPLTLLFIAISLGALLWTARSRRTLLPAIVGAAGALGLLIGKFAAESDPLTYAGIAVLMLAAFLPLHRRAAAPAEATCSRCVAAPANKEAS